MPPRTSGSGSASRRKARAAPPQTATVTLPNGKSFTAPTTVSNLSDTPPTPVITRGPRDILFFAGSCDDPFFFDIPGFNRFVASVIAGKPDPSRLKRGRDSFAGYNTQVMAFSFPVSFFGPLRNNTLGVSAAVFNPFNTNKSRRQIDRVATPGVNVSFTPLTFDDLQNSQTTLENTRGPVPAAELATIKALGTDQANTKILTDLFITHGDFVRVDTTIPNKGKGGGTNPGAGFPNGRRLGDDVVDKTLSIVTNGNPATSSDNAGDDTGNLRRNEFPFVAPPIQPFPPTNPPGKPESSVDDRTQN